MAKKFFPAKLVVFRINLEMFKLTSHATNGSVRSLKLPSLEQLTINCIGNQLFTFIKLERLDNKVCVLHFVVGQEILN